MGECAPEVQSQGVTHKLDKYSSRAGDPEPRTCLCNGSGARVVLTSITTRACERATVKTCARVSV